MKIDEIKLKVQIYNSAKIWGNSYIILNRKENKYLTFNTLINKIYEFGKQLLDNVPDDFLTNQELSEYKYGTILNLFLDFFNKEDFVFCNCTPSLLKNKSLNIISKDDIISMSVKILKIYNYQQYYDQIITNKNSNDYCSLNKDNIFGKLHSELEKYRVETKGSKIELEYYKKNGDFVDTISSFDLVFSDWYSFALYNMIYNCFNIDRKRFVKCIKCGKMAIKTNNRQKHCPECSEKNKKYNSLNYKNGR